MKVSSVAVDSLTLDPANVRRHPERNLDAIKASLKRFGQRKPIVVDADGIVRAGNGTLEAARALGWAKIDVVRMDARGSEAVALERLAGMGLEPRLEVAGEDSANGRASAGRRRGRHRAAATSGAR